MNSTNAETEFSDLADELKKIVTGEVRFDDYSRNIYSTDASIYRMTPSGVVIPRDADDVAATIEVCAKNNVSILPRGGGTSLSGQTVNTGVVIDFSKYMHNILEINAEEKWVKTQPGITIDELNRQLAHTRLHFTPDPSTSSRANVGGAMGNNSCGSHSIIYGKTVDQVQEMSVILSDGSNAVFKQLRGTALEQKMTAQGLEGNIYRNINQIAARAADEIETRFPKILRRVGGYNIDRISDQAELDLTQVMVGSEGTLAAVTDARLKLWHIPKARGLAVLHFNTLKHSMEATVALLELKPAAIEHIGELIISQARKSLGFSRGLGFLQGNPSDILVVEVNGESNAEVRSKLERVGNTAKTATAAYTTSIVIDPIQQKQVWAMRQAGLGLMMNVEGDTKPMPFVEDTAVAPEKLPEYVERFDEIVTRNGTEAGYYGHASVGCLHIRPLVNLKRSQGIDRMYAIADEISDLVLEFGGSLSGEHGDGIVRGAWAEKMFGQKLVNRFREVKNLFDPNGIMNPGKVFDTPDMRSNLRYGSKYNTATITTKLDWNADGGFAGAIERCNGVGACRKVNSGAMCPSYMATREEEHSTRGRANALRAAISGALPIDEVQSERMYQVLDLCLECKSCKSECPSNVDMAKIKYEFLNLYYETHRTPLRSQIVADIHRISSLAAGPQAPIANFLMRSAPSRWFAEKIIGIDQRRKLPKTVSQTFQQWFSNRTPNTTGTRGDIVLFHDTFMNFNHPEAGIATVKILEALGYRVRIADRVCCARPMISSGMLERAAQNARANVEVLYPYVESGTKIVGCESSCILTLRDEYPDLLTDMPEKARAVSESVVMLEELLTQTANDGRQQIKWSNMQAKIMLHVHCHERALIGTTHALNALNLPHNFSAQLIDAGCCGMAGSFGFAKEHYDVSIKVGEDRLLPVLRNADPETQFAITGVSCKQQIEDQTERPASFISQILAQAL